MKHKYFLQIEEIFSRGLFSKCYVFSKGKKNVSLYIYIEYKALRPLQNLFGYILLCKIDFQFQNHYTLLGQLSASYLTIILDFMQEETHWKGISVPLTFLSKKRDDFLGKCFSGRNS